MRLPKFFQTKIDLGDQFFGPPKTLGTFAGRSLVDSVNFISDDPDEGLSDVQQKRTVMLIASQVELQ